jgi:L-alanine-DL-glutamate epimerase-like enolase superfamily enzyme
MLKSRILGENPCHVDRLFRRIKQFGGHGRQGGGVSGIEVALWDLAAKAYGVPVCQMLGGRFRERVRMYCDTHAADRPNGESLTEALERRIEMGFTFLKMDLGIWHLHGEEGALSAPPDCLAQLSPRSRIPHPFTGSHITERGLDALDRIVAEVRSAIGDEIPLAVDHLGHLPVEDGIRIARRLEKHSLAWLEDLIPWHYTDQYVRLSRATTAPLCTGEDIYLKESFRPLLERRAVAVAHPDVLTAGGLLETKKIGDLAQDYGVAMAIHMAESPVACMAAAHVAAATENFLALEFHAAGVPWWDDIVTGLPKPLIQDGFITVPDKPGLGIDDLDDEVIKQHLHPRASGLWEPTDEWNDERASDRLWS